MKFVTLLLKFPKIARYLPIVLHVVELVETGGSVNVSVLGQHKTITVADTPDTPTN